jgi:hypothetical protein
MTMKNIFTGLLAFVTLLSCEQKKDETLVLHSEADLSLGFTHLKDIRPITVRLTHTELTSESALDFMVEDATASPLPQGDALKGIREKVQGIVEEPTSRGFRVKILI